MIRHAAFSSLAVALSILLTGCVSDQLISAAGSVASAAGVPGAEHVGAGTKVIQAGAKALEDFTPDQKHYIGRSIAATITSDSGVVNNNTANMYINLIGQTLAALSDKPQTWSGYHFIILDTDEINGFAAPGGFIMISRGLLKCCKSEDEVAAVLAHEVAHVQLDHGMSAISKGRKREVLKVLAIELIKAQASQDIGALTGAFGDTIADVINNGFKNGYSREFEATTDLVAVDLLQRAGYDPYALTRVLDVMNARYTPDKKGFAKTHPDPSERITNINKSLASTPKGSIHAQRQARYTRALGNL